MTGTARITWLEKMPLRLADCCLRFVRLAGLGTASVFIFSGATFPASYTTVARLSVNPPALNGIEDVLAVDHIGRLAGTQSGTSGGQVFVLIPKGTQGLHFSPHILFSFTPHAFGGPANPTGGVTPSYGGLVGPFTVGGPGCGGIYRLDNPSIPTVNILHYFLGIHASPPDGSCPQSGLTVGLQNYLYGTTIMTSRDTATIFAVSASLVKPGYQIIYHFAQQGDNPSPGRLAVDSVGTLYGALESGGAYTLGSVYALPHTEAGWKEQVIYDFNSNETLTQLNNPVGNVALDANGDIYGCAQNGTYGQGGIFRLTPPSIQGGDWSYSVLYAFGAMPLDPIATSTQAHAIGDKGCGITIDPATNVIYGTSYGGGTHNYGTIFSLTPPQASQTQWTETIIHSFDNSYFDGAYPVAPPLKVGNTYYGGTTTGSVYAFQP